MRDVTVSVVVGSLFLCLATPIFAQGPPPFGADVFGGWVMGPPPPEDAGAVDEFRNPGGWQVGATLRRGERLQWLGVTGKYTSGSNDQVRLRDVLGGVSVTSPFAIGNDFGVRAFAHALGGAVWSRLPSGVSDSAPAFALGGGVDFLFVRLQGDWIKSNVTGTPGSFSRAFLGGVVPLCFAGCRPEWKDGIPVRR